MNVLLFTPIIATSAIGRMAALVARALVVQGQRVTVVRTEASTLHDRPCHDFGVEIISWRDESEVQAALGIADLIVHQVGNSFDYHEGNLHWLEIAPSVLCLHDFYLGHLFYAWAQKLPDLARKELERWYGPEAPEAFFSYSRRLDFIEVTSRDMPMTEWVAAKASAVVAHSSWGMQRVLSACSGPVLAIPLAYDICPGSFSASQAPGRASNDITLLTVGHVNPNKRVESVIRAIGSSEMLREHIVYRLVGLVDPCTILKLTELSVSLGVRIVVSGEVDDATLSDAFLHADLVSCLRWPSLESASASAIEAMLHGKPILVTDTGFYSELPDDCVVKIAPGDEEVSALRVTLERLLEDAGRASEMGARAAIWASGQFSAHNYARRLTDLAPSARRSGLLLDVSDYFAGMLTDWCGSAVAMLEPQVVGPLQILSADVNITN